MDTPCTFPDCANFVVSKNLCQAHYKQQKRGEALRPLRPFRRGAGCAFGGCAFPAKKRGWCTGHYQQTKENAALRPLKNRNAGKECSVEGCADPADSFGLCDGHAQQRRRGLPLAPLMVGRAVRGPNHVEIVGDVAYVALTDLSGEVCARVAIDATDMDLIRPYKWRKSATGYAITTSIRGKLNAPMHRLILEGDLTPEFEVDHHDGDRLNNRRLNLRAVTHAENMQNVKMPKTSGLPRNVYFDKRKRKGAYRVELRLDDHIHKAGRYDTIEEAAEAAKALRASLFTHHNETRC